MDKKVLLTGLIKKGTDIQKGYITADLKSGLITDVKFNSDFPEYFEGRHYNFNDGSIICCGDFNCHSHPEQSIYTDMVDKTWDLGTWCKNTIYKYSVSLEAEHIYLACCRAFSRMITYGVTSVMVSFYCHGNKGNILDEQVIKAAKDTGIRLYFGRMNYDIINKNAYEGKKNSQKSYYETVAESENNFLELMNKVDLPTIVIAPAIHSIHASTKEAIVNAINLGNKYDRLVQFHLSESYGDVDLSKELYNGLRPIEFLDSLVKNGEVEKLDNVILSDCIWINSSERELIESNNMKVVLNPRMNHRVKAGKANLPKFLEKEIALYLGTDGEASNDDLSITGERKFLKMTHPTIPDEVINSLGKSPLKFKDGFIGDIAVGNYCDLKVIHNNAVRHVFVGGKRILRHAKLITMDIEEDIEQPLKIHLNNLFK